MCHDNCIIDTILHTDLYLPLQGDSKADTGDVSVSCLDLHYQITVRYQMLLVFYLSDTVSPSYLVYSYTLYIEELRKLCSESSLRKAVNNTV